MSIMTVLGALLPEMEERETRMASVKDFPLLPDGDYSFRELYCADKGCDCRRVTFHVYCFELSSEAPVATLSFGWEAPAFYARWSRGASKLTRGMSGISIDPLGPQSEYSEALVPLLQYLLTDPDYVDRLKQHYQAFKAAAGAIADQSAPLLRRGRLTRAAAKGLAFRMRITLRDIAPPIWRLIEVPASYSFWDLHIAIQDAMGWECEHLHAFSIPGSNPAVMPLIGVPPDSPFPGELPTIPSWEMPLIRLFGSPGDAMCYEYDFGDAWEHDVVLEEVLPTRIRQSRPRLLDGARACPPEDCGGVPGYEELVAAMKQPLSQAYRELREWLGKRYDPERFDKVAVRFSDPKQRG